MRGKALKNRRQRNRELAALDASRRCQQCKRALADSPRVLVHDLTGCKFCSSDCLADYVFGYSVTGRA